jgi:hypothetical protein
MKAEGNKMSCHEKIDFIKGWKEENVEMLAQGRLGPLSLVKMNQHLSPAYSFQQCQPEPLCPYFRRHIKPMQPTLTL